MDAKLDATINEGNQFKQELMKSFSRFAGQMSKLNNLETDKSYEWLAKLTRQQVDLN